MRHLADRIGEELGAAAATCIHIGIETVRGLEVCVVEVDPSPDPVWLWKSERSGKRRAFYVRTANATRELRGPDLVSYHRKRWDQGDARGAHPQGSRPGVSWNPDSPGGPNPG